MTSREHSTSSTAPAREEVSSRRVSFFAPEMIQWWFVLALVIALFLNIGMGAVEASPRQIVSIISVHIWGLLDDSLLASPLEAIGSWLMNIGVVANIVHWIDVPYTRQIDSVVWNIRLPRTLLATVVGAGLAVSGASMQGLFRNPLADPGLIGVSTGASLGAILAIVAGLSFFGMWTLPFAAFLGAMLTTLLVYTIARHNGRTEVVTLILAGVAITAILGAAIGMLMTIATDAQLRSITFWTLGSLGGARWSQVGIVTLVTFVGSIVCIRRANALNLLALGEREARHLGIEIEQVRVILIVAVAMMVGSGVAFTGTIGFVGLVVPHLIRLLRGPDHHRLLPLATIAGATLLLFADLISRTIAQPREIPIGVTMSLVGGPFFLWLLLRMRDRQGGWG
ncbi:MAG: iron ABC transporter permease [Thermomicrobiales bacterium]|nr:iron ABC transporter permease [Thermomicrobiales bacterium]